MSAPEIYAVVETNEGLFVSEMTPKIQTALVRAINKTADRGRTRFSRAVREQINFSATYINQRLKVTKRASRGNYEALIRGRDRATSLARFSRQRPLSGGSRHRGGKVNVQVKAGGARRAISRAWIARLKNGNVGLAVRTEGGPPSGAYKPTKLFNNVYLLYGPSVDQALVSVTTGRGVVDSETPEVQAILEREFFRLLDLEGV